MSAFDHNKNYNKKTIETNVNGHDKELRQKGAVFSDSLYICSIFGLKQNETVTWMIKDAWFHAWSVPKFLKLDWSLKSYDFLKDDRQTCPCATRHFNFGF